MLRRIAILSALVLSSPAWAGGIGPYVMGGFHTAPVYYYSPFQDDGVTPISDPAAYRQFKTSEIIGNAGAGLEFILGDKDDPIQGVFRGFWMMDTPETNPNRGKHDVEPGTEVAAWRTKIEHTGVATVGLQWRVVQTPNERLKLRVALHVGSGFASPSHNEFLLAQAGLNLGYLVGKSTEIYVEANYALRYRKVVDNGMIGALGVRFLFD